MKGILFRALAVLMLGATAPAFGAGGREATAAQPTTLQFALSGNPNTLDPHATAGTLTFQVIRSVYDTLVEPDESGRIVPALAESWDVSADARHWTFSLRPGVRFHNGDEFTSQDVVATFARLRDPGRASVHAPEFAAVSAVEALDRYTVRFSLERPHAPLLSALASGWSAILPHRLIATGHDFGANPVGTGPFVFEQWVRDNRITLARNDGYWIDGQPAMARVNFNIITEVAVQVQGLLTGDLHIIDMVGPTDIARIEQNPATRLDTGLSSLVMVMAINTRRPPLSDVRVRRALNYAIDKQTILDVAYAGGRPIGTFMDAGDPFAVDLAHLHPHDVDRARGLIRQAGGVNRVLDLVLPQNFEPHVRAGEMYQQMLAQAGIEAQIRLVDWSTWLSEVYGAANFDLTVIGHTGKLDPDGRFSLFETDRNYVGWSHPEIPRLLRAARIESEFAARGEYFSEIQRLLADEVPFVFVGTNYRFIAMRETIQGFHMDGKLDTYDLRRVRFR